MAVPEFTSGLMINSGLKFVSLYAGDNLAFNVTAVPEASTWFMMLVGMGMVLLALHRRRSESPAAA